MQKTYFLLFFHTFFAIPHSMEANAFSNAMILFSKGNWMFLSNFSTLVWCQNHGDSKRSYYAIRILVKILCFINTIFYVNFREFNEEFLWKFALPCHQKTSFLAIKPFKCIWKTPKYLVMSPQKIINAPTNEEIKFEKIHFSIVKLRLNAIWPSMRKFICG